MILLVFLGIFAVVFGLLLYGAVWATEAMIERTVTERHRALEEIVNTGSIPRAWNIKESDAARANRRHMKRLDSLARYVKRSQLVQGEETREFLLDRISGLREDLDRKTAHEGTPE